MNHLLFDFHLDDILRVAFSNYKSDLSEIINSFSQNPLSHLFEYILGDVAMLHTDMSYCTLSAVPSLWIQSVKYSLWHCSYEMTY